MSSYRHTQTSPLFLLFAPIWFLQAIVPFITDLPPGADLMIWWAAGVALLATWHFSRLTVVDEGETIAAAFGKVWILGTRIRYDEIVSYAEEKTSWTDGWGLHYVRGGWLWNVWGFDCIRITTEKRTVRIGTDDVAGLFDLLAEKTGGSQT
ncbi:hypothetical protein SH668x_001620 [Planctomicrobium sp. SH668]|uniref:hypothetical protein n=1 Tax=Planctomicrobium sp. SH668 TaxID=3448126 RepID=UPI003F5C4588